MDYEKNLYPLSQYVPTGNVALAQHLKRRSGNISTGQKGRAGLDHLPKEDVQTEDDASDESIYLTLRRPQSGRASDEGALEAALRDLSI